MTLPASLHVCLSVLVPFCLKSPNYSVRVHVVISSSLSVC